MRVVSLVPAATEMVAALGAESMLVGISHECDWPPTVQQLPRLTTTPIDSSAGSGAIDASVRAARREGRAVIAVDRSRIGALRPDLIITQDLCDVCAVGDGEVLDLAAAIDPPPRMVSLTARTLDGIFDDLDRVGAEIGRTAQAAALAHSLRGRLAELLAGASSPPPRVVCIEWLEPVYLAGHWVPELIAWAGGQDVGAEPGAHSRVVTLAEAAALAPDLVLVAPCGFGLDRAESEFRAFERTLAANRQRPISSWGAEVRLLDGNAYTSRPGPRVVDGAERIAAALRGVAISGLRTV